jgi:hypothetical protein
MTEPAQLIEQYFDLAPRSDTEAYFAQFAADAIVEDEGQERHGLTAVRTWRTEVPPVRYAVRDVRPAEAGHEARVDISGDFPGSPVCLTFHFEFDAHGHIAILRIRP